ncbi:RluA family pseudouridine synthase [Ancylomarina sp.]|uniref:RluA family pseudouridine synthase n=1 Tax=Ancylomarina sp. TaxID=1970196 RepID=UPI003568146E
MEENQQKTKKISTKYQPKGLTILFEDQDIIVVNKISGLLTMASDREREKTAYFLLSNYVKKGSPRSKNRVFIVHRLDKDTSGVLVFAKTEKAKFFLQDEWQSFSKKYVAVLEGKMREKEGIITSYLAENSIHRVFSVRNADKGKFAKTGYKVIKESERFSLVHIHLFTGRKNQIRVHFYDQGCPVAGDKVYGEKSVGIKRLALHAATLTIRHPHTNKEMTFETNTPSYFKQLIKY